MLKMTTLCFFHKFGESLSIDVSVLSGANIASEIAKEMFAESTIGFNNPENGQIFQRLFNRPYFKVDIIHDVAGVEMCGSLKNVVAIAAGFIDGIQAGMNAKAALIRNGLLEMKKFISLFFQCKDETFFQNCGIADVIVTSFGGRNRMCAELFVKTRKSFQQLEEEILKGQKLQGTITTKCIKKILEQRQLDSEFPIFTAVYSIAFEGQDPNILLKKCV